MSVRTAAGKFELRIVDDEQFPSSKGDTTANGMHLPDLDMIDAKNVMPTLTGYTSFFGLSTPMETKTLDAGLQTAIVFRTLHGDNIQIAFAEDGVYIRSIAGDAVPSVTIVGDLTTLTMPGGKCEWIKLISLPAGPLSAWGLWSFVEFENRLYVYTKGMTKFVKIYSVRQGEVLLESVDPSYIAGNGTATEFIIDAGDGQVGDATYKQITLNNSVAGQLAKVILSVDKAHEIANIKERWEQAFGYGFNAEVTDLVLNTTDIDADIVFYGSTLEFSHNGAADEFDGLVTAGTPLDFSANRYNKVRLGPATAVNLVIGSPESGQTSINLLLTDTTQQKIDKVIAGFAAQSGYELIGIEAKTFTESETNQDVLIDVILHIQTLTDATLAPIQEENDPTVDTAYGGFRYYTQNANHMMLSDKSYYADYYSYRMPYSLNAPAFLESISVSFDGVVTSGSYLTSVDQVLNQIGAALVSAHAALASYTVTGDELRVYPVTGTADLLGAQLNRAKAISKWVSPGAMYKTVAVSDPSYPLVTWRYDATEFSTVGPGNVHIGGFKRYGLTLIAMKLDGTVTYLAIGPGQDSNDVAQVISDALTTLLGKTATLTVNTAASATATYKLHVRTVVFDASVDSTVLAQDGTELWTQLSAATTPIPLANVEGICKGKARMVAWDKDNAIYWSAANNATDFTPSPATRANTLTVAALRGNITLILPYNNGFVIYGTGNIIRADYVGDTYTYKFNVLDENKGISDPRHAVAVGGAHYLWTNKGLVVVEPESGKVQEFGEELVDWINTYRYPVSLDVLSDRYLVIYLQDSIRKFSNRAVRNGGDPVTIPLPVPGTSPLGIDATKAGANMYPTFDRVLIFDVLLKKWGTCDEPCKRLSSLNPINQIGHTVSKDYKHSDAIIQSEGKDILLYGTDGLTRVCNTNQSNAYCLFGHYSTDVNDFVKLVEVEMEFTEYPVATIEAEASLDGATVIFPAGSTATADKLVSHLYDTVVAKWFNILVRGRFNIKRLLARGYNYGRK